MKTKAYSLLLEKKIPIDLKFFQSENPNSNLNESNNERNFKIDFFPHLIENETNMNNIKTKHQNHLQLNKIWIIPLPLERQIKHQIFN